MNAPQQLTHDDANDLATAWTPDSKAVLLYSNRNGTPGIFKQGINQDTAEPVVTGPQGAFLPRLSADGAWILYLELSKTEGPSTPARLMRIPAGGGAPQLVLQTHDDADYQCAHAPASLCAVSETSVDGKQLTLTAFDPLKGRGEALRITQIDPANPFGETISPDGTIFALSRKREAEIHIHLLSLSGGPDREIKVKGWPNLAGLDWSPDGKGFYCGSVSAKGRTLLYVDLEGNARVLWQSKGRGDWFWGVPSPDGRYVAIRSDITDSYMWMLEGF